MKKKQIATVEEATKLEKDVIASAERALAKVQELNKGSDALKVLWQMKVGPVGCDPLNSESPLNLIEQLNQTFTYIASARAVKILLEQHPSDGPYKLNLGTAAGTDIESDNGRIAAEVFAAVNTSNNRKLANDIKKVSDTTADVKYVFFMCPDISKGRQSHLEKGPDVKVWSVGAEL